MPYINANTWNPKNAGVYNLIYKAEVETQTLRTNIDVKGRGVGRTGRLELTLVHY